jgi:hypothetical protein
MMHYLNKEHLIYLNFHISPKFSLIVLISMNQFRLLFFNHLVGIFKIAIKCKQRQMGKERRRLVLKLINFFGQFTFCFFILSTIDNHVQRV